MVSWRNHTKFKWTNAISPEFAWFERMVKHMYTTNKKDNNRAFVIDSRFWVVLQNKEADEVPLQFKITLSLIMEFIAEGLFGLSSFFIAAKRYRYENDTHNLWVVLPAWERLDEMMFKQTEHFSTDFGVNKRKTKQKPRKQLKNNANSAYAPSNQIEAMHEELGEKIQEVEEQLEQMKIENNKLSEPKVKKEPNVDTRNLALKPIEFTPSKERQYTASSAGKSAVKRGKFNDTQLIVKRSPWKLGIGKS